MVKKCNYLMLNIFSGVSLLVCLLMSACDSGQLQHQSQTQSQLTLKFSLPEVPYSANQVAFFIYDIKLIAAGDRAQSFTLDTSRYPDQVALITLGLNQNTFALQGSAVSDTFNDIEFIVGVPDALNHANPLQASSPLNNSQMFWSWQQGYKFLRIDGHFEAGDTKAPTTTRRWAFHLGSTGCASPSALRPPVEPCRYSHRVHVRLEDFDPQQNHIEVNLAALLSVLGNAGNTVCTADYQAQPVCVDLLAAVGLDAQSGECAEQCAAQTLFRSR